MFDFGFSEMLVVAVVALIVLGPERLPKAARFAGLWVRRARAQWYSVKSELESELADDELKRSLRRMQDELQQARAQLREGGDSLRRTFDAATPDRDEHTPREPAAPEPREPGPDQPSRHDPGTGEPVRRDPDQPAPEKREPDPRSPDQPEPPEKRLDAGTADDAPANQRLDR
ncbi:MAG TPA: Sec-independent protein translocase protein TatB [Lysobacter sp.]|nr:Sec-independent protein translocase protein TatB [Lysobacter sp.]